VRSGRKIERSCFAPLATVLLGWAALASGACHVEPAGSSGGDADGGGLAGAGGGASGRGTAGSGGATAAGGAPSASSGGAPGSGGALFGSGGVGSGGASAPGGGKGSGGARPGTGGVAVGGAGEGGRTSGAGGAAIGAGGKAGGTGGGSGNSSTGAGGASAAGGSAGANATGGSNAIVAVGYGGLRIVSHDLGITWQDESHWGESGGDDNNLLRSIAYGNGVWVAGGWRYVTSTDGVKWTDHGMTVDAVAAVPCNIIESIAFGQGRFVGACGDNLVWSTDGLAWKKLGPTPGIKGHPWIVFDPGTSRFAVTGDNSKSFVSADMGATWTELTEVVGVRLCKGGLNPTSVCPGFYADGVFLRGQWPAQVQRSTNGTSWSKSVELPAGDSVFTDYSFAVGPVGP
jgi:hypothetical protein